MFLLLFILASSFFVSKLSVFVHSAGMLLLDVMFLLLLLSTLPLVTAYVALPLPCL